MMPNKNSVTNEEVDLGQLFKSIGKMFSKIYIFFERIFKGTFHYFILLLVFFRAHILKLTIALLVGAIIGFGLDQYKPQVYTYDMVIQPNYDAINQIFENIESYNVLIKNKDYAALSKKFNTSLDDSENLKEFELIPLETHKTQLLEYDLFLKETDTALNNNISFNDFKSFEKSDLEYRYYIYRIKTFKNNLTSLEKEIIADIESNTTLLRRQEIQLNALKIDSLGTRNSLNEVRNLRTLYEKMALYEMTKDNNSKGSGTYIDLSKEEVINNDIQLFTIAKGLNNNLIHIETKKELLEDIVNIITTFNIVGKNTTKFYQTKTFLLASLFFSFTLLFVLMKKLNIYLAGYKK